MSSLQNLKKKIKATKGVKKTTRTMELISSVYLRKYQNQVRETKKFSSELQVLKKVLDQTTPDSFLYENKELPKVLILFSAFRGLNGNFDALLRRNVFNYETSSKLKTIIVFGKKGSKWVEKIDSNQIEEYDIKASNPEKTPTLVLKNIAKYLKQEIIKGEIGQIDLISMRLKGSNYFPINQQLLEKSIKPEDSIEKEDKVDSENLDFPVEFDKEFLNEYVLENHIYTELFLAYFESLCAENLARTFAMKQSTKAASEMIDKFTLKYNNARQGKITQEVSEIISGLRKKIIKSEEKPKIVIKI